MNLLTTPTAVNTSAFFTDIAGDSNRLIWSPQEIVNEVQWSIPRTSKWWSDNLWRVINKTNGGAVVNSQPLGINTATTSTGYIIIAGTAVKRYDREWLGNPPRNRDAILPNSNETRHNWTRIYSLTSPYTQVVTNLEYNTGKIVDAVYNQFHIAGEVYTIETYSGNTLNGLFQSYYTTLLGGLIEWDGQYANGEATGVWNHWTAIGVNDFDYTIIKNIIQP